LVAERRRDVERRTGILCVLADEVGRRAAELWERLRVGDRPLKERVLALAVGGRMERFLRGVSEARRRLVVTL
jgi:hypothetical protein